MVTSKISQYGREVSGRRCTLLELTETGDFQTGLDTTVVATVISAALRHRFTNSLH